MKAADPMKTALAKFLASLPSMPTTDLIELWLHGKTTDGRTIYRLAANDHDIIRREAREALDQAMVGLRAEINHRMPPREVAR